MAKGAVDHLEAGGPGGVLRVRAPSFTRLKAPPVAGEGVSGGPLKGAKPGGKREGRVPIEAEVMIPLIAVKYLLRIFGLGGDLLCIFLIIN